MKWSYFGNRLIITHIAWAWDYIGWFLYMAYSQWEAGVVDEEAEAERMRLRRQEERKRKRRARGLTCVEDDYYDDSDDAEPAKETVLVHDVFTDKDGKLLDVSKIDLKHHAGKKGKDTDLWQWRTETRTKRRRLPKTSMRDLHLHAYTHLMRFLYPKEIMAIRQVNRLCRYEWSHPLVVNHLADTLGIQKEERRQRRLAMKKKRAEKRKARKEKEKEKEKETETVWAEREE